MANIDQGADGHLLAELGGRLARIRLDKDLTQGEVAREAGVGVRTLQRLESGEAATQLSAFLRVCRVLGLTERLDLFIPVAAATPSPMDQLKLEGRRRRRASGLHSGGAGSHTIGTGTHALGKGTHGGGGGKHAIGSGKNVIGGGKNVIAEEPGAWKWGDEA